MAITGATQSVIQPDYLITLRVLAITATSVQTLTPSIIYTSPKEVSITITDPGMPAYILCEASLSQVEYTPQPFYQYCGNVVELARFVSKEILVGIQSSDTPFLTSGVTLPSWWHFPVLSVPPLRGEYDHRSIVEVTLDQSLPSCNLIPILVIGMTVVKIDQQILLFATQCVYTLESNTNGVKTFCIAPFALYSDAGSWNPSEIRMDFLFERNRPSVELWDLTSIRLDQDYHSIAAFFSRDVYDVDITRSVCENCLIINTKTLSERVVTFDIIPTHPINPSLMMRVVVPESVAIDLGGYSNVRSTPLAVTLDNAAFSVVLTSELMPLTSNSTIACQVLMSEIPQKIAIEDFVVKNGYILEFDENPHTVKNETTGKTYVYYDFVMKATVQGQVCVEVLKSK